MATCSEYYYAEDQDGNNLPFTAYFDLYSWNGSFWEYVDTLDMPPGSMQSVTLEQGDKYRGVAEAVSGWTTPAPIELTACSPDFYFIYTEHVPEGDILSGDVQPTDQEEGLLCDFAVTVKNVGLLAGSFTLKYYEGASYLGSQGTGTIQPGVTVPNFSKMLTMPDHDFTVQVRMYNDSEGTTDDTYNITCYLASDYYVKVGGNDSLSGRSWANAWATVNKAATTVPDGKTVHLGYGVYNSEPAANKIAPQNIGVSGILYKPEPVPPATGGGTVEVEVN